MLFKADRSLRRGLSRKLVARAGGVELSNDSHKARSPLIIGTQQRGASRRHAKRGVEDRSRRHKRLRAAASLGRVEPLHRRSTDPANAEGQEAERDESDVR
jgi:hypothetical protein